MSLSCRGRKELIEKRADRKVKGRLIIWFLGSRQGLFRSNFTVTLPVSPFVITSTWNYPSLHYSLDYQLRQVFPAAPCPLSPILICPVDGEFLPLIIINSTPTEILLSHTQFSSKFNLRLGLSCVNFGLVVTDLCTSEANERWGKFTIIRRTALPPPWKSHLDNWNLFKIKFWIFPLKIKFSNLGKLICPH